MINVLMFISFFIFMPMVVLAQTITPEITDQMLPGLADKLSSAVTNKNYMMLAGVLLAFTVWGCSKFIIPKLRNEAKYKEYLPGLTVVLSLVAGIATWFLNPNLSLMSILATSAGSTAMASGTWEVVLKPFMNLFKKKEDKASVPVATPVAAPVVTDPIK